MNVFLNISPKIEECLKAKEDGAESERYFKLPQHIFEDVNDIHRITRSEN